MDLCRYVFSGIFNTQVAISNKKAEQDLKRILQQLPKPFGYFVTLKSGEDVYGCIGNYTDISIPNIIRTGRSARNDYIRFGRRNRIEPDQATVEISILYSKEPLNSRIFNNDKYGIIGIWGQGSQATFLPGVFPGANFADISQQLMSKAGAVPSLQARYYMYKTLVITCGRKSHEFGRHRDVDNICKSFRRFNYIPYETRDCLSFSTDPSDHVRNASVLADLISICGRKDLRKLVKTQGLPRQAKLMLINVVNDQIKSEIIADLERHINVLEPKFELGEALVALVNHSDKRFLTRQYDRVLPMIDNLLDGQSNDDVFQLNWLTQFVTLYIKKYSVRNTLSYSDYINFMNKLRPFKNLETNYLAVMFETLCHLLMIKADSRINNLKEEIYQVLINTRRTRCNTFKFKNGVSRIDITFHVLNGLNHLP